MTLLQLISTVRRRRVLNAALRLAATGLAAAAIVAAVLLLAERLSGLAVVPWAYAVIVAAGGLLGVAAAIARRPGSDRVAVDLDRELGLEDRFGSALASAEMSLRDAGADIELGSGVAAAQDWYLSSNSVAFGLAAE